MKHFQLKRLSAMSRCFVTSVAVLGFSAQGFAAMTSYAPVSITKPFADTMKQDIENKPALMKKHRKLLNERYDLSEKVDESSTMSGGKP